LRPCKAERARRARSILAALGVLGSLIGCVGGGLAPEVKAPLKAADAALRAACEGMAQTLALQSGADAQRIVAATCAVEGFTRTLREMLLAQQLEAARAAGVAVPNVTSDHLEPMPAEYQAAE
jgi:hypothetical protein